MVSNKIEVDTRKMSQIKWILNTLLYIYTIDQDWDDIAELLVCCDCLYWHPPFYQTAWEQLIAAQKPDGSVPRFSKSMIINDKDLGSSKLKIF